MRAFLMQERAAVAQLVERNLAKVEVESSRLFCRSRQEKGKPIRLSLFYIYPPPGW